MCIVTPQTGVAKTYCNAVNLTILHFPETSIEKFFWYNPDEFAYSIHPGPLYFLSRTEWKKEDTTQICRFALYWSGQKLVQHLTNSEYFQKQSDLFRPSEDN
uniref:Uncharacterized protein n=1 Tax=Romanomermis culicivorax TaxID=13658 RepID=A0A915KR14_ROMCU